MSSDDLGFIGFLMTNYYVGLGNSFYFKPGVGLGGFTATRSVPDPTDIARVVESDLSGFAAKLDLGFAFYAGRSWNLKAGLDLVFKSGSDTPIAQDGEEVVGKDFTLIEAGFTIGMGDSF